jgi:hypothetical protein
VPHKVTAEEALQHCAYDDAIAGSRAALRKVLQMVARRERYLAAQRRKKRASLKIEHRIERRDPENACAALFILGIAGRDPRWDYSTQDNPQLLLEPWAVQAALSRRRGGQRLSEKEVREIERCTRDAGSLRWPRGARE